MIASRLALLAGETAAAGIVLADAVPAGAEPAWIGELGRLPVQGLLALVCGFAVWIIYRQSRDFTQALARENELWRQALAAETDATQKLADAVKTKPCLLHKMGDPP